MFYEPPHKWTEELLDELPFGEDDRFEWKSGEEISKNNLDGFFNKLAKEIGAFANSFGGTLFIGVDDDKKKVGIPATAKGTTPTERWLENKIPILFELRLQHFRVSRVELTKKTQRQIGSDKIIIAIDIFDSELAPHQCVFDSKYYYRSNSESRPAPHHYLAFLWGRANSNMSQVATWWIKGFINPTLDLISKVYKEFNQTTFTLKTAVLQAPYYRIYFFERWQWNTLMSSNVGEYFLTTFPTIERELSSFVKKIDSFDESLEEITKSITTSAYFLKQLKDIYERLISRERIPRSQFEHFDLDEITRHLLGQLNLNISNHAVEGRISLVNFTVYAFLEIEMSLDVNTKNEAQQLSSIARELSSELRGKDKAISKLVEDTKQLMSGIGMEASMLVQRLKKERMDIAKRYTTTFE
jgi:hypothetical protein